MESGFEDKLDVGVDSSAESSVASGAESDAGSNLSPKYLQEKGGKPTEGLREYPRASQQDKVGQFFKRKRIDKANAARVVSQVRLAANLRHDVDTLDLPSHAKNTLYAVIDTYAKATARGERAQILRLYGEAFNLWGTRQVHEGSVDYNATLANMASTLEELKRKQASKPLKNLETPKNLEALKSINSETEAVETNGSASPSP